MLTKNLVSVIARNGRLHPCYLTTRDHGWVEALQDVFQGAAGQPLGEAEERLHRRRLPGDVPLRARRGMTKLLLRRHSLEVVAPVPPAIAREALFLVAGAQPRAERGSVVAQAAAELGVTDQDLEASLYADLPSRRILQAPSDPWSTATAIERYNLALAQTLLLYTERLVVKVRAQARQALRFARLQRLLVLIRAPTTPDGWTTLELSGALSLFRFTLKYGRSMANSLPALTRLPEWSLSAQCRWRGEKLVFEASHRDPLGTTHAPSRRFDSKLEERFFRDLQRRAPQWRVWREASPEQLGDRVVCPDFTLNNDETGQSVAIELVGYWTPRYLADKVRTIKALPPDRPWLLCVDSSLAVALDDRLGDQRVFWFNKRIKIDEFLLWLESTTERAVPTPTKRSPPA